MDSVNRTVRAGSTRRIAIASLAVLAAVCVLSAPFTVTFDSEAKTLSSDGYVIRIGAEADSSEKAEFDYDLEYNWVGWKDALKMVGLEYDYNPTSVSPGSRTMTDSVGESFKDMRYTEIFANEYEYLHNTFTFSDISGNVMIESFKTLFPEYSDAVIGHFGKAIYETGDTLKIKGDFKGSDAFGYEAQYGTTSGTKCVITSEKYAEAYNVNATVTITFTPDGGSAKELKLNIDAHAYSKRNFTYDYGKKLSEVNQGDPVHIDVSSYELGYTGTCTVTIGETEYELGQFLRVPSAYDDTADVYPDSDVEIEDLSGFLDGKSATENISFSKGYAAAESLYNKVMDGSKGETNNLIVIAGAGVGIAALAAVAYFFLRKKSA